MSQSSPSLTDYVISKIQSFQFFRFVLDDPSVAVRLSNSNEYSIVLGPTNDALRNYQFKPWQKASTTAVEGELTEAQAVSNTSQFVQRHIIPSATWTVGETVTTMIGTKLSLAQHENQLVILPGNAKVTTISKYPNGEIWSIDTVIPDT